MKDLAQQGGENSVNNQAGRDLVTIQYGTTPAQVTEIALAIARDNMGRLKGYAQDLVDSRVELLIARFIREIAANPRASLDAVRDPDVQYSLLTAEKEFARSGDEDKAALLVGLLADRCAHTGRGLQALVLNEAISTVARLTTRQVNTLTASWLVTRVVDTDIESFDHYVAWLDAHIRPFVDISEHDTEYQHLAFLGCVSFAINNLRFGLAAARRYPGALAGGFFEGGLPPDLRAYPGLFKPCVNDPDRLQVAAGNPVEARALAEANSLNNTETESLVAVLNNNAMNEATLEGRLGAASQMLGEFVRRWNGSRIRGCEVTSVGTAIAHANWARQSPDSADLGIWIPADI